MNAKHISDALDLLDDDIIEEINTLRGGKRQSGAGRTKWLLSDSGGMRGGGTAVRWPEPAPDYRRRSAQAVPERWGTQPGGVGFADYLALLCPGGGGGAPHRFTRLGRKFQLNMRREGLR